MVLGVSIENLAGRRLATNRLLFTATAPFSSGQREVWDSVVMLDKKKLRVRGKAFKIGTYGRRRLREPRSVSVRSEWQELARTDGSTMYLDSALWFTVNRNISRNTERDRHVFAALVSTSSAEDQQRQGSEKRVGLRSATHLFLRPALAEPSTPAT